ncbi:MAG: hypothetical protein O3A46_08295, partial [Candidatus Poribacteria bacterium]|nr:hypothetical protein [Candidatus Poribacteria bacterium]
PDNPPKGDTDWDYLDSMTDEEAYQNALDDPDNPPMTEEQLKRAIRLGFPHPVAYYSRLKMTRAEFSQAFEIPVETIRAWERCRQTPSEAYRTLMTVIWHQPDAVLDAMKERSKSREQFRERAQQYFEKAASDD